MDTWFPLNMDQLPTTPDGPSTSSRAAAPLSSAEDAASTAGHTPASPSPAAPATPTLSSRFEAIEPGEHATPFDPVLPLDDRTIVTVSTDRHGGTATVDRRWYVV